MVNTNFTKITEGIEVRESWPGGPLREFAKIRPHGSWGLPFDDAEWPWAAAYVCGRCKKTAEGVYSVTAAANTKPRTPGIGWLCPACKEMATGSAA
jgi:hypothetical protein